MFLCSYDAPNSKQLVNKNISRYSKHGLNNTDNVKSPKSQISKRYLLFILNIK